MKKALILLFVVLSGCYEDPVEPEVPVCRTDNGTFLEGSGKCKEFKAHERLMIPILAKNTGWSEDRIKKALAGLVVTVRPKADLQYTPKYDRWYWTDYARPFFFIWASADCQAGSILLAEDTFARGGVLTHEVGHIVMGCSSFDHDIMVTNGVSASERDVGATWTP